MIILICFLLKDLFSYEYSCLSLYTVFHEKGCSHVSVNCPLDKLCPSPDVSILQGELGAQTK